MRNWRRKAERRILLRLSRLPLFPLSLLIRRGILWGGSQRGKIPPYTDQFEGRRARKRRMKGRADANLNQFKVIESGARPHSTLPHSSPTWVGGGPDIPARSLTRVEERPPTMPQRFAGFIGRALPLVTHMNSQSSKFAQSKKGSWETKKVVTGGQERQRTGGTSLPHPSFFDEGLHGHT